jgi:two-component system, OmpR family, sensor kinase
VTWSIRARLTLWYSLVVVTVVAAGAIAVARAQERLALERLDGELQRLMLTLDGVMRTEFEEGLDLQAAAREASKEVVAPDRTIVLVTPDGTLLAAWGLPLPTEWRPPGNAAVTKTMKAESTHRRLFSKPRGDGSRTYVAAILAPLAELEAERSALLRALSEGVLIALAVAGAGGWLIGRQTLRPLTDMARQATAISERDSSARLEPTSGADEIGRFAVAFNGLLDRLSTVLRAQRQFMADASHELRTPVSVVRTTAQVTLARDSRSADDYRESLTIIAEQSARLGRLVDSMFLLSRAEAQGIPLRREPLYIDDVVAESARALRVLADERSVTVEARGDVEVTFSGDDMLLRQLVGNLLENAIRHARPAGTVTVDVQRTDSRTTVRVTDDGEGIPPDQQERIFERFVRLDKHSAGAGLGLPIARWIAEAHGGHLVLEYSRPGGTCFALTLPAD